MLSTSKTETGATISVSAKRDGWALAGSYAGYTQHHRAINLILEARH